MAGTPQVRQYAGGASNLTYLLRYPAGDLILRRPPVGAKARGAHDMGREFRIQSALRPVFPRVPRMVAFCDDDAVLGSDFYVMERVAGDIPRRELPLAPARRRGLRAVRAHLGRAGRAARGRRRRGAGARRARHAVRGTSPGRWPAGPNGSPARATDDLGDWTPVTAWLDAAQPPDAGQCLIHNDFRLDNLVLDPRRTPARASPPCSTGRWPPSATRSWTSAARWRTGSRTATTSSCAASAASRATPPGMWSRAEIVAHYARATGRRVYAGAVAVLRGLRALPAGRDRAADLVPLRPRADHQPGVRRLRARRRRPGAALPPAHRLTCLPRACSG